MPRLSPRLQFICDSLLPGEEVWDTCCDHGYVGEWALRHGGFGGVHFVDRVPAIVDKLRARLADFPSAVFWGRGAGAVDRAIGGTAVIAGVGGRTVREILEAWIAADRLRAQRLILGPQKNEDEVIAHFAELLGSHGYHLSGAKTFREGRRDLPLLVWDRVKR